MISALPTVPVLVGPTASGKTGLSLRLAEICDGEIISADSRQIYKYMRIGTAKPSAEQMDRIPHHCVDFLDPSIDFSAGEYAQRANAAIEDVIGRKHLPVVVGGSGLYIRALIDGMFDGEIRDERIRSELKQRVEEEGIQTLHAELQRRDPAAAEAIHPNNVKRVLRALEIVLITGQTRGTLWRQNQAVPKINPVLWGLNWPREILYQRINDRVDWMIAEGLVDEVKSLILRGFGLEHNSMDSLGYKEVISFLNHEMDMEKMRKQIQQNTRRFAKRQMTWFRADKRIRWISMHQQTDPDQIAQTIKESLFSA